MSRSWLHRRSVGLLVGLTLLGAPGILATSALASRGADVTAPVVSNSTSVASAAATLQQQLADRLQQIAFLSERVAGSHSVTNADRSALNAMLASDLGGLSRLQIAAETDASIAQVRADSATMVLSFHVYALVTPVVLTVLRLDAVRAAAVRITAQLPSIRTQIVASAASSGSLSEATTLLESLAPLVAAIQGTTTGLASALEALAPSSIPAALPMLDAAGSTAATAEGEMHVAYATIGRIITLVTGVATSASHLKKVHAKK